MALRAGYYGFKKKIKNKLEQIVAAWDELVAKNTYDTNLTLTLADGVTLNPSGSLIKVGDTVSIELNISADSFDTTAAEMTVGTVNFPCETPFYLFDVLSNSEPYARIATAFMRKTTGAIVIPKGAGITAKRIFIVGSYICTETPVTPNRLLSNNLSESLEDVVEEPITKKRTTKKSTAKADTTEEV